MNSDITPRGTETGLNGHYEPNEPGATSLRDARPLWIDHQHVTAEVHDGTITVFVGLKIAYDGALPEFITSGSMVNAFAAEMAYAWARPDDDDEMAEPDVIPAAPLAPQFAPVGDPWDAIADASQVAEIETVWRGANVASDAARDAANTHESERMQNVADTAWDAFYALCNTYNRCAACWAPLADCPCV